MQDSFIYIVAFVAGVLTGLFYFLGLWMTLQALSKTNRPAAVLMVSFFGRSSLVVCTFFVAAGGKWHRLLPVLAGFIFSRTLITRKIKSGIVLKPSGRITK